MTISSTTSKNQYTGNGSNVDYTYSFKIFDQDDIRVILTDTNGDDEVQVITTDYSVSNVGDDAGGTVTFVVAPPLNYTVTLKRNEPLLQDINYVEGDDFPAAAHEEGLDRSVIRDQFLQEQIDRSVKLKESSSVTDILLDDLEDDEVLTYDVATKTIQSSGYTVSEFAIDVAAAAASAASASSSASTATTQANNAAASAVSAAASAAKLSGTSTTSVAIATGSKAFTTQADKFFDVGSWLLITSDADEANYMHGQVTAYSGTSLTVDVTNIGGSGTLADWTIRVSGTRGATGATGPAGSISDGDKGDITVLGTGTVWTVDNDAITYAKMQNVSAASRLLGRGSASGAGDTEEIALGTGLSMSGTTLNASATTTTPTIQVFTASGTWNRPSGCTKIKATIVGGGGGGGSNGGAAGSTGGTSSLSGSNGTANGGTAANDLAAGVGGTSSNGDINYDGSDGNRALGSITGIQLGGAGAAGYLGAGAGKAGVSGNGDAGAANTGAGGGGASPSTATPSGGGGGAGGICIKYIDVTSTSSLTVTVGAGGNGSNGGGGNTGGAGGSGIVIIEEYY